MSEETHFEITPEMKVAALAEVFGQEYADNFQDPAIFIRVTLHSQTVKQFYKRDFGLISRTLFLESVYRRLPAYDQSVLDEFSSMAARKLSDVQTLLTNQANRLMKICRDNGVQTEAAYLHPETRVVPIIAGHARIYILTLGKLDEVYQLTATAVLNGVIDSGVRRDFELQCRKAVRTFAAMLRFEVRKLWKESHRMRASLTQAIPELDKAEKAHDQAVQAFDASLEQERTSDPGAHVEPEDAARMIDDMAAQTAAAKNSGRRRKGSETDPAHAGIASEPSSSAVPTATT